MILFTTKTEKTLNWVSYWY